MSRTRRMTLSAPVLDAPDPHALADFYRRLLGWRVVQDEPDWVKLRPPNGGTGLSFQTVPIHAARSWPTGSPTTRSVSSLIQWGIRSASSCGRTRLHWSRSSHYPQNAVLHE